MKKKIVSFMLVAAMGAAMLAGCGNSGNDAAEQPHEMSAQAPEAPEAQVSAEPEAETPADQLGQTEITVFAAASLSGVLDELIGIYNESQPNIKINTNYDSSGTLMTQIEEGAACDVFFSAAQKQMNQLQDDDGLVVDGTRHNVVNNQVCVVTYEGSGTDVTGLADINKASSIAMADGSVPVGKYTRQALVNLGSFDLPEYEDVAEITTEDLKTALGVEDINECGNVSIVTTQVAEGSNEVGTVYYSDTYGKDGLEILEHVSYDLTGDVIYPVAQIVNSEADELEQQAAADFINFLLSDAATAVFDQYLFDTVNLGE